MSPRAREPLGPKFPLRGSRPDERARWKIRRPCSARAAAVADAAGEKWARHTASIGAPTRLAAELGVQGCDLRLRHGVDMMGHLRLAF